ncbi:PREDICTED: protein FD isoform X1 [Erythranthe guttata]|uniref:protein FD isoform X1 n=1 Tax=Erythranthe guttata TaxID=4155 RepID=UPI00064D8BCC|nr:PREDICTED: protein FD isoform X1 [Erythranthe guttata]|eukprot:XP_012845013.1 PREDICTED: protein FD isoform X1 [Erythranthe guttata]
MWKSSSSSSSSSSSYSNNNNNNNPTTPAKTMEEVWKDISFNITSDLTNHHHNHHHHHRQYPTSRGVILQDFFSNDPPPPTNSVSQPPQPPPLPPPTMLTLNSVPDDHFSSLLLQHEDHHQHQQPISNVTSVNVSFGGAETAAAGKKRFPELEKGSGDRRHKRMIKNRESAARSRARKQAYTIELELEVAQLLEENAKLKEQQEKVCLSLRECVTVFFSSFFYIIKKKYNVCSI